MLQPNKNKSNWQADKEWLENWYNNRIIPVKNLNEDYQKDKPSYLKRINQLSAPTYVDKIDDEGSEGFYDKDSDIVKLLQNASSSVNIHEGTHFINNKLGDNIKPSETNSFLSVRDNILPQNKIENQWVKDNYEYLSNFQEVIGRVNPYRQKYNLQPDQVITPDLIKANREKYNSGTDYELNEDQLYKLFDDEGLSNILNSLVLNENKSDTQVAKFGGKIKDMKKKNNKYAFGNTIEDPATALYENQIALAKAQQAGDNDNWAQGFQIFGNLAQQVGGSMMNKGIAAGEGADGKGVAGFLNKNGNSINSGLNMMNAFSQFFAMGGTVPGMPVEVEGQEVAETPDGQLLNFQGPSHENGGIPVTLPEGTEMYSKRIKVDGVSMADRKKKRENRTMTLETLFEKNNTDSLIKNSLKKTKINNEIEETADNKIQEVVKQLLDKDGVQKYAYGDTIGPTGFPKPNPELEYQFPSIFNNFSQTTPFLPTNESLGITTPQFQESNLTLNSLETANPVSNISSPYSFDNLFNDVTIGDAVGLTGNLISTFGPMKNTQANRAGDTPNINAFENYGQKGLETLDESKKYINQIREQKLKDLALARTSSVNRNNNSARSINTQRALNLATDAQINNAEEQTYDSFAQAMMAILSQESGMENQIDSVVMQGEQAKDLANRQDRDNYFSQLGIDIVNKGYGLQETGKDMNQLKENKVAMNLINQLSAYGITVDEKGNLSSKNKKK